MTSKEAYEKSQIGALSHVREKIESATKDGRVRVTCMVLDKFSKNIIETLELEGYKVLKDGGYVDETKLYINWDQS